MIKPRLGQNNKKYLQILGMIVFAGLLVAAAVWYNQTENKPGGGEPAGAVLLDADLPTEAEAKSTYQELVDKPISDTASAEDQRDYYGKLAESALLIGECQAAVDGAESLEQYNSTKAFSLYLNSVDCFRDNSDQAAAESLLATIEQKAQLLTDNEEKTAIIELVNMKRFEASS